MRRAELRQLNLKWTKRLLEEAALKRRVTARWLVRDDQDLRHGRAIVSLRFREQGIQALHLRHQRRIVEVAAVQVEEALVNPVAEHEPRAAPVLPDRFLDRLGYAQFLAIARHCRAVLARPVHLVVAERDSVVVVIPELAVQTERGDGRAGIVGATAQLAVEVARRHEGEIEMLRAQQFCERVVAKLRVAAELEHVAVERTDDLPEIVRLLRGAQEDLHRVRHHVVVEQKPIDHRHLGRRIAESALAAALPGFLRGHGGVFEGHARVSPSPAQGSQCSILRAQPVAKRARGMRAVIAEFIRVNTPVIPLLAHQPGDHVSEHLRAIVRLLHVTDDSLQRGSGVGAPLHRGQRREGLAVAAVPDALRVEAQTVGEHLAFVGVGVHPPFGRGQIDAWEQQPTRIRLEHAVSKFVELFEIKRVRPDPGGRGKAGSQIRREAEHVRARVSELAEESCLRHVGLEDRLRVGLAVEEELRLAPVPADFRSRAGSFVEARQSSHLLRNGCQHCRSRCSLSNEAPSIHFGFIGSGSPTSVPARRCLEDWMRQFISSGVRGLHVRSGWRLPQPARVGGVAPARRGRSVNESRCRWRRGLGCPR